MLSIIIAALIAVQAYGHAEFVMADSTFRTDYKGRHYCSAPLDTEDIVMGKKLKVNSRKKVTLKDSAGNEVSSFNRKDVNHTIHFSGANDNGEFVILAKGATFKDGGCMNSRTTLEGMQVIPGNSTSMEFRAVFGNCNGEPPVPCQLYTTESSKFTEAF